MIRQAIKLFTLLNSETNAWQLAFGASFGMILGFTPLLSLHNVIVLFLMFALRVNLSFAILSWGICSGFAYLLDNSFHQLGWSLLNSPALHELFTAWYNNPVWRWSRFNNTVVIGSLVVASALFVPMAVVLKIVIARYRQHLQARLEKLRIVQALKASRWYNAFNQLGE
jgi:uncharacterized protein (TIGR03546 family)